MPGITPRTLLIASDHAGFTLKGDLLNKLRTEVPDLHIEDLGPESATRCDYPDFAERVARRVSKEAPSALGLLICGSGIGMAIAANKIPGVRATTAENPVASRLAREHNAVNVLCLGARFVALDYAWDILQAWLSAAPSRDDRHQKRVAKIIKLEA